MKAMSHGYQKSQGSLIFRSMTTISLRREQYYSSISIVRAEKMRSRAFNPTIEGGRGENEEPSLLLKGASSVKDVQAPKGSATGEASNRDVARGVWELARLHTKEAWLCWYPAIWGACLSAGNQEASVGMFQFAQILFGILASVTATHCAGCTWNDLCDKDLDKGVERCKTRPLPSGMITYGEAVLAFVAWIPVTVGITYATLGEAGVVTFAPIWFLSLIYPLLKRVVHFPQVILGAIIGGAVFPGWTSITGDYTNIEQAIPLFAATMSWVVYFDVFYASQDRADDEKVGVKGLAVWLGDKAWIFLAILGVLQVAFFTLTAVRAHMSLIFWVFGIGVWAINMPWHVLSLDMNDRKSGGRIFKQNIMLGLYMTGIALIEFFITRVYLQSMIHIGEKSVRYR